MNGTTVPQRINGVVTDAYKYAGANRALLLVRLSGTQRRRLRSMI